MALETIEAKVGNNSTIVDPEDKESKIANPHAGQGMAVQYDFGGNLEGLADLIVTRGKKSPEESETIVYTNSVANMTVTLQGLIRRCINSDKTSEETQAEVDKWLPGVASSRSKLSVADKVGRDTENASSSELDDTIRMLEEQRAALEDA